MVTFFRYVNTKLHVDYGKHAVGYENCHPRGDSSAVHNGFQSDSTSHWPVDSDDGPGCIFPDSFVGSIHPYLYADAAFVCPGVGMDGGGTPGISPRYQPGTPDCDVYLVVVDSLDVCSK